MVVAEGGGGESGSKMDGRAEKLVLVSGGRGSMRALFLRLDARPAADSLLLGWQAGLEWREQLTLSQPGQVHLSI